jgi:hypothetical protein
LRCRALGPRIAARAFGPARTPPSQPQWNFASGAALTVIKIPERGTVMLTTILIVILILALLGAMPTWGYSRNWGYGPGGGVGLLLIIIIILALSGHI